MSIVYNHTCGSADGTVCTRCPRPFYILRYNQRPFRDNTRMHYHAKAAKTLEWRQAFAWLAKVDKVPPLVCVEIIVRQFCKDNRRPDVGACFPAAKAAIDGLIDAGVLVDDGPDVVVSLKFDAPVKAGFDAMELEVVAV